MRRPAPGPQTRSRLAALAAVTAAAASLAALPASPAAARPAPSGTAAPAVGRVFMVNPVQSSGDEALTDAKDADTAVPADAYATVPLRNLDGSGTLTGRWATVSSSTGALASSATGDFRYTRSADQFEQVMAYFWVNEAQEYLQGLGFGSELPGANDRAQPVRIDQWGADNSFFTDRKAEIRYGKGGVDDAEDAEVVVHEYGHAVHAAQVPGFGASEEAGAIGEAFGDYLAVEVGLAADARYGWPRRTPDACVADWDSTSYTSATPHCLRRIDTDRTYADKVGEVHADGEIWSRALYDIRNALGARTADRIIVDAQFGFAPDTDFAAAAATTVDTARRMYGAGAADAVRRAFAARGIPGV
ncbi:M4 family metallopeptidase [Streptacidiphilus sp. ASG 303]|uniref:M4 family metallopeptidase n=1 Tax=Streptacidiphilus sp. ASG 303 TaxID=2896847 RepID=UPI001E342740|nr:M4 family metallopeptidase [Streptacidiphilus sp. ASG 303]MCD0481023.1 M4 family metallopeptidase [Streptacidiphilus sp. ASG 303]